jgi:hypothetical protein
MVLEIAVALVTIFMLAVVAISARSYLRTGNRKVLIVTCAFGLFFLKGVVLSLGFMQEDVNWEGLTLISLTIDAIAAILLFLALIVRKQNG